MGVLIRVGIGGGRVWEERIPVGMSPRGAPVASLGNSNYMGSRV